MLGRTKLTKNICYSRNVDNITIIPLEQRHKFQIEGWGTPNALKTLLKLPEISLGHGTNSESWAAMLGDEVLAVGTITLNPQHVGYLDFLVKPSERRQGIGLLLVEGILRSPFARELGHLHARVEPENTAAQKILSKEGFSRVGTSEDGKIEFAYHSK
jgi:ribosomal protein S18 acetylase RimI-like enzyme